MSAENPKKKPASSPQPAAARSVAIKSGRSPFSTSLCASTPVQSAAPAAPANVPIQAPFFPATTDPTGPPAPAPITMAANNNRYDVASNDMNSP